MNTDENQAVVPDRNWACWGEKDINKRRRAERLRKAEKSIKILCLSPLSSVPPLSSAILRLHPLFGWGCLTARIQSRQ
jgi:hypothetical protein